MSSYAPEVVLPIAVREGGENVERVKIVENISDRFGKGGRLEPASARQKYFPDNPGLKAEPIRVALRESRVLGPFTLFLPMPVRFVTLLPHDLVEKAIELCAIVSKAWTKYRLKHALSPATPGCVTGESRRQALGRKTHVKTSIGVVGAVGIINAQIVVRLVGTLILGKTDIAIDARQIAVGFSSGLEIRIESQQEGLQSRKKSAKRPDNVDLVLVAVRVKPRLVVVPRQLLKELEGFRGEPFEGFSPSRLPGSAEGRLCLPHSVNPRTPLLVRT